MSVEAFAAIVLVLSAKEPCVTHCFMIWLMLMPAGRSVDVKFVPAHYLNIRRRESIVGYSMAIDNISRQVEGLEGKGLPPCTWSWLPRYWNAIGLKIQCFMAPLLISS